MSAPANRSRALDCAKGIAMIAVVTSHAMRGAAGDGILASDLLFRGIDDALYLWHVQLFLMISGFLAYPRAGDWGNLWRREGSLAYSYLLWSAITLGTLLLTHRPTGYASAAEAWLAILYAPIQHYWFLVVLMLGYALLYVVRDTRWLFAATIACLAFSRLFAFSYYGFDYYLIFFLSGAWIRAVGIGGRHDWRLDIAAAALLACGIATSMALPVEPPTVTGFALFSFAGCYLVFRLAEALASVPPLAVPVATIGRLSLPIYLAHIFFTAGARELVEHLGIMPMGWLVLPASLAAGLGGPLILYEIARRTGLARALAFEPLLPSRRLARPEPAPAATVTKGLQHPVA